MHWKPRRRKSDWTALAERSEGRCEMQLPGCWVWATDPCHRIGTKAGGRQGEAATHHDRLSNVLHGCRPCHDWQTGTGNRLPAEAKGYVLREHRDTLAEPVRYRGVWSLLDDEGRVTTCASS
jgi:hypothetical protein